ncbi:MAG: zinc-ribbon domain-containing protein [Actinobacteria bacterium]|nr:zinc-ribbon domain-containing protein [Actinomycetota bacterium]
MANITKACTKCNNQFLVIDQEQKFLSEKGLPLPNQCPSCRQLRRLMLRGERKLYRTTCHKCGKEIITSYDPRKAENVILCKKDYDQYLIETDLIIKDPLPEL